MTSCREVHRKPLIRSTRTSFETSDTYSLPCAIHLHLRLSGLFRVNEQFRPYHNCWFQIKLYLLPNLTVYQFDNGLADSSIESTLHLGFDHLGMNCRRGSGLWGAASGEEPGCRQTTYDERSTQAPRKNQNQQLFFRSIEEKKSFPAWRLILAKENIRTLF